jgi:hypothetical protein
MWSLTAGCWLGSAGGSRFVRRVRTSSGAVAVQLVTRQGRQVLGIERVGSAHTDEELALLLAAKARLMPGQDPLEVEAVPVVPARMDDVADWTLPIGVGDVRLHHAALRERRRGRRPEGAAQSRHEQGAPGRPAGPGRPTGGSDGVPARGPPVRGQHRRDHHPPAGAAHVPGPARDHQAGQWDGRGGGCRDAVGGESERDRGRRVLVHRRVPDHQSPLRPGRPLRAARRRGCRDRASLTIGAEATTTDEEREPDEHTIQASSRTAPQPAGRAH